MSNIIILGLGNPLLKDDGIGPHVVQKLQKKGLPSGVTAIEAGGSYYQYWDVIARSKYIIVIDSLLGEGPPGTIYLLSAGQIVQKAESELFRHEDNFLDFLDLMAHFDIKPEVTIIGVEPKEINYSLELSPEISAKIPDIIQIIEKQIQYKLVSFN